MTSSLISIGSSGIAAAQAGLDVTAQNISNASTAGYVRRTISQTELTSPGSSNTSGDHSLSGVLVTGIGRNVDSFLQSEARSTGSDAARADTLVTNLQNLSNGLDDSNLYSSITSFQQSLTQLASSPTDTSQRANVLASAQALSQSFNLASNTLASAAQGMQTDATGKVAQINQIAKSLSQLNVQISADTDPQTNQANLFDQRDSMLQKLSQLSDVTATFSSSGTVTVNLGGASGPQLVSGGTANTLSSTTASDGTMTFSLAGATMTPTGGALAADQQGLTSYAGATSQLNTIATSLITAANTAQASGVDLNGATGAALFSGTGAGNIAVSMTSGSQLATAAAGSGAGSLDTSNLTTLQNAITTANVAGQTNSLMFSLSSSVSNATTAQTALDTIANSATTALSSQSGVNLDQEAANLLQYQQAFQASGKVIQVATTIFNQLLGIQ